MPNDVILLVKGNESTLEYRINGGVTIIGGGGWKWFNITVIRGVGIIGGGGSWRNRK